MTTPPDQPSLVTVTNTDLLNGLKDPKNESVWQAYVERYRPLVVSYACRVGIAQEEAEDIAQGSLLEFSSDYRAGKYDRTRGRLRSWLFGIVQHQIGRWRRAKHRNRVQALSDAHKEEIESLSDEDDTSKTWEAEWNAAILRECLNQIRREIQPTTFRAFELFVLQDRPAEEVAQELGMSANAVFKAKRRVADRIKDLLPLMDAIW